MTTDASTDHAWMGGLRGRFIVFDGPDGSGKSTQLRRFAAAGRAAGLAVAEVREPGGTPIGEHIRRILLDTRSEMTLRCEMLLYMASRAQLVEQTIAPALGRGELVLADRFVSSTYAYQGAAGGLPTGEIDAVAGAAVGRTMPDLVLVFDVDGRTAARRTKGVAKAAGGADHASLFDDRIEARGREFHERVRQGFLRQVGERPDRFACIDASQPEDAVWSATVGAVRRHFSL